MVRLDNMRELPLWNSRRYMFRKNSFLYSFILFWFVFTGERGVYCQKECQKVEVWHLTAFVVHNHIDAICQVWSPNTFNTWRLKLVAFQRFIQKQHFCQHRTSNSNAFTVIWGQQSSFKHLKYSVISIFMYQGDKHVKHRLYKHGGQDLTKPCEGPASHIFLIN